MKYSYNQKEIFPYVEYGISAVAYLSGIGMRDIFLNKQKCAYAWKTANEELKKYFGNMLPTRKPEILTKYFCDFALIRKPVPPAISYGHLISIGAPVTFPVDGEPNVSPFAHSVDEAIDILKERKGKDFSEHEIFRHYLDIWDYLKQSFPEEEIPFVEFKAEGPITSAHSMRGEGFFYDIYDEPEKSREFLGLLSDSIIDFVKLCRKINGQQEIQEGAYIADDLASLMSPDMWGEFVIPFWKQIYEGLCNGKERCIHVENLVPEHLKYLKQAEIAYYQPSVSPKITLESIKENLDPGIAFDWMLTSFQIIDMTEKQIEEWVDNTVHAGVTNIRTQFGDNTIRGKKLDRIEMFFKAFEKYRDSGS